MNRTIIFTVLTVIVVAVNGRVFYLQNLEEPRPASDAYPVFENREQFSRDLDLSFSAGDSDQVQPFQSVMQPTKKVYTLVSPERPSININKEIDRPVYYKLAEVPAKRNGAFDDIILAPERNPKLLKINGGRGDVVVELRVIANHDDA